MPQRDSRGRPGPNRTTEGTLSRALKGSRSPWFLAKETFADYDLDGFVLRSGAPEESARTFVEMGFAPGDDATTVKAGEYSMGLTGSASDANGGGMLFHVGCLVDSAEDHRKEAEERGLEVQDFVEGPNTLAVFVRGPEGVSVEYVEHKSTFSLT